MITLVSVSCLFIFSFVVINPIGFLCLDVVEFDNSFSYLRSKKIWYSITFDSAKPICLNGNNLDYLDAEIQLNQ